MALAVFREQRHALPDGVGGRCDVDRLSLHDDAAAIALVGPEDRPCQLGAPGTDQSGDAENLATAQLKADVVQYALARQILYAQDFLSRRNRDLGELVLQVASHHHTNELVDRRACDRNGPDPGAIAQNGGTVA